MTNNAAERALRGVAIGRANWTFAGSDRGSQRAAAIYTLTETGKLNGVDPQAYLADVLARLPDYRPVASLISCPGTRRGRNSRRPRNHSIARELAATCGLHRMHTLLWSTDPHNQRDDARVRMVARDELGSGGRRPPGFGRVTIQAVSAARWSQRVTVVPLSDKTFQSQTLPRVKLDSRRTIVFSNC